MSETGLVSFSIDKEGEGVGDGPPPQEQRMFYCFELTEENKWRLKEISSIYHLEEKVVVNALIERFYRITKEYPPNG